MMLPILDSLHKESIHEGVYRDAGDVFSLSLRGQFSLIRGALHLRSSIRALSDSDMSLEETGRSLETLDWDLRFHTLGDKYQIASRDIWIAPPGHLHFGTWNRVKGGELVSYQSSVRDERIPLPVAIAWLEKGITPAVIKQDLHQLCKSLSEWVDKIKSSREFRQSELRRRESLPNTVDIVDNWNRAVAALRKRGGL